MRKLVLVVLVAAATLPHRNANACGVPDFRWIADAFKQERHPIFLPDLMLGVWLDGSYTVTGGLLWGEKTTGFLAGPEVSRVLLDVHHDRLADRTSLALTYGKYGGFEDSVSLGADAGVQTDFAGAGPAARVQLGLGGFAFRLSGAMMIEKEPYFDGRAEVVVDFDGLVGAL